MKKLLLMAGVLLGTMVQAQTITVNTPLGDGVISNNEVFTFNTINTDINTNTAKVPFTVTNNTAEDINIRIRVDEVSNTDGSNVQLCFGVCLSNIHVGTLLPTTTIPANSTTPSPDDHFLNGNAGTDTGLPVEYRITFVQADSDGNVIADLVTFTYRYDVNAATDDFTGLQNMGITLNQTVVKNQLQINASQHAAMQIYGMNGQAIQSADIKEGYQAVDVSSLSTGIYIVKFTNNKNQASQIRIVKQ